jgi:hypothetical protein
MDSLAELREKCQAPVRAYNDVAGLMVGDHVSIHVTRLFIALGLSPTIATVAMLVFGVSGSLCLLLGELGAVAGFALLFAYYICDCVDGEVARYRKCDKLSFALYDFMIHLVVKSTFFLCFGAWAVLHTGRTWVFAFALAALISVLFRKFLQDLPLVIVARAIVMRTPAERRRFLDQLLAEVGPGVLARDPTQTGEPYRPKRVLSIVRAFSTNFDLAVLVLLAVAILDLAVAPFTLWGLDADLKLVAYVFYGTVLPLDFLDRLQADVRGGFFAAAGVMLGHAHRFDVRTDAEPAAGRREGEQQAARGAGERGDGASREREAS